MPTSRRAILSAGSAAALLSAVPRAIVAQGQAGCKLCRGVGFVPLKNPKPYVFVEGMPPPKAKDAVPHAHCPDCQADNKPEALVELEGARLKTIEEFHKKWEKNYGAPFVYVETRHLTMHTLLDARESQRIGVAVESLCAHLQKLTGTMELTSTRPDTFHLFLLWERAAWDQFRAALEKNLTREQLGEWFAEMKNAQGYQHPTLPHFYETPQTARTRPPVHGALAFFGRRQIYDATRSTPAWLAEGFAAYCEYAILKNVQWYSIYNVDRRPAVGDSLAEIRRIAAAGKLRRFERFLPLRIRDYEAADYPQAFSLVYYLFHKSPVKFLDYLSYLRGGEKDEDALEKAFEVKLQELEKQWGQWAAIAR